MGGFTYSGVAPRIGKTTGGIIRNAMTAQPKKPVAKPAPMKGKPRAKNLR